MSLQNPWEEILAEWTPSLRKWDTTDSFSKKWEGDDLVSKKPLDLRLNLSVRSHAISPTNASYHNLTSSPNYMIGQSFLPNQSFYDLRNEYQNLFPWIRPDQLTRTIDGVHIWLYGILRNSQPRNIQADIVRTFSTSTPEQKLILANTLGNLLGEYTYNVSVNTGVQPYITANTEDVFGAFQEAIRTGHPVEAGMCVQIHTAIAETLHGIGIPSALVQVIKTDNGSGWALHAVTMMQIWGQYIITDYGKTYVGWNRDEAIKKYEELNQVSSIKHFITDQSGKIVGIMQTPRGKLLEETFSARTLDSFLRDGKLPDGVTIEAYGSRGEIYFGIEARKHLWDFYIKGKAGKSLITWTPDSLTYHSVWVWMDTEITTGLRVWWEYNVGTWDMTFDGKKSKYAKNQFQSSSLQASYKILDTGTTKIEAWVGWDNIRQLKWKSQTWEVAWNWARQIGGQSRVRSWIQLSHISETGTRYFGSMGASGEVDNKNLGDSNRENPKVKIVDPKRSTTLGFDTYIDWTKVGSLMSTTRSNISKVVELSLSFERWVWSGDISWKKTQGRWTFWSPESREIWGNLWYKINDSTSLQAGFQKRKTDGGPSIKEWTLGANFRF